MKTMNVYLAGIACLMLFSFISCSNDDDDEVLKLEKERIEFKATGNESQKIAVIAKKVSWDIVVNQVKYPWLDAEKKGNYIIVKVKDNTDSQVREGDIQIDATSKSAKPILLRVKQNFKKK